MNFPAKLLSTVFAVACCFSISFSVMAASSYQFSLGGSASQFDILEGESYSLGVAAYIKPVELDGSLPYDSAAFYTRTSGLFLGAVKTRFTDLNIVRSGAGVMKKQESSFKYVGARLAQADFPLWLGLNYRDFDSTTMYFTNGNMINTGDTDSKRFTLGAFLTDHVSMHAFYEDANQNAYGSGVDALFDLDAFGFIGAGFEYKKVKAERIALQVVNGSVRNLDVNKYNNEVWAASLSYYPSAKSELNWEYAFLEDGARDVHDKFYSVSASYYFFEKLRIGLTYTDYNYDNTPSFLWPDYKAYSVSANYRF